MVHRFLDETTKLVKHQNGRINGHQILMYLEISAAAIKNQMNEIKLDDETFTLSLFEVEYNFELVYEHSMLGDPENIQNCLDYMRMSKFILRTLIYEFRNSKIEQAIRSADDMVIICNFIDEYIAHLEPNKKAKTHPHPVHPSKQKIDILNNLVEARGKLKEIGLWLEKHAETLALNMR